MIDRREPLTIREPRCAADRKGAATAKPAAGFCENVFEVLIQKIASDVENFKKVRSREIIEPIDESEIVLTFGARDMARFRLGSWRDRQAGDNTGDNKRAA